MEKLDKEIKSTEDNSKILKKDLLKIAKRMQKLEEELHYQIGDLETREDKMNKNEEELKQILQNYNNLIVKINVSGKKFSIKLAILVSVRDTLFYKLVLSGKFDLSKEIFFDRSPRMFSAIIDYFRYKKVSYKDFSNEDLIDLKREAEYYEIGPICDYLKRNNCNN